MLLDCTYFTGELSLPMLSTNSGPVVGVAKATQSVGEYSLEWFIEKYELEFLHNLLGEMLAQNFIDGIQSEMPLEIWTGLKDVIYPPGKIKLSPAANYVYFHAMRWANTQTAMTGEVKHKSTHMRSVNSIHKLVYAWNDMADPICEVTSFVHCNWAAYSEYSDRRLCSNWFDYINHIGV